MNEAFHPGERAIQARLSVREKMAELGARVVRDHIPAQHRMFFEGLPYLFYGAVDQAGRPWASVLTGSPGFVSTPDDRTLRIDAAPMEGDPLSASLEAGSAVGLLGLDLSNRRRNRVNGLISEAGSTGISVGVRQSFGNCPKYIQTRSLEPGDPGAGAPSVTTHESLTAAHRELISAADTFFITTGHSDGSGEASEGVDVSHRGGKPGFVGLESDNVLVFPDFAGNRFFNTLGNLQLEPRCGLTFIDFEQGGVLYTSGTAEVLWGGDLLGAFTGAERLVRYEVADVVHTEGGLPFRFSPSELSPFLGETDTYSTARGKRDAQ